mmetsp:Transcript_11593/g.31231  ORF Transcript_11593/g.31231 Transcript_11593/m.31231 type:complete len:80 (+) Transcript_11593:66-305(+)
MFSAGAEGCVVEMRKLAVGRWRQCVKRGAEDLERVPVGHEHHHYVVARFEQFISAELGVVAAAAHAADDVSAGARRRRF